MGKRCPRTWRLHLRGYPSPPPIPMPAPKAHPPATRILRRGARRPGPDGSESSRWTPGLRPRGISPRARNPGGVGPGGVGRDDGFQKQRAARAEIPSPDRQATVRFSLALSLPRRFAWPATASSSLWSDLQLAAGSRRRIDALWTGTLGLPASSSCWFFSEDPRISAKLF